MKDQLSLTNPSVIELLEQLLGTHEDVGYHPGAEMEVSAEGEDEIVVVALARHYRIDGAGIWMRPLGRPGPASHPYFIEPGNHVRLMEADGTVKVASDHISLRETDSAAVLKIRAATDDRRAHVSAWDDFYLQSSTEEAADLDACIPDLEDRGRWPEDRFV